MMNALLAFLLLACTAAATKPPSPPMLNWTAARATLRAVAPFAAGALVGAALVIQAAGAAETAQQPALPALGLLAAPATPPPINAPMQVYEGGSRRDKNGTVGETVVPKKGGQVLRARALHHPSSTRLSSHFLSLSLSTHTHRPSPSSTPIPTTTSLGLPLLEWTTTGDPAPAFTVAGLNKTSSFRFAGGPRVGGASVKRKGTTSLGWPKPKLRLAFPQGGEGLAVWPGEEEASHALDINSLWGEVTGAPSSYVREAAAFSTFTSFGVPAPRTRHAVLTLNGKFWGLVSLVERMDGAWLLGRQGRGGAAAARPAPTLRPGPGALLFKPEDATWANLRPDAGGATLRLAWKLVAVVGEDGREAKDKRGGEAAWRALEELSATLAGVRQVRGRARGPARLSSALDLPGTLNYLAVAAALLHADRCTKNYFLARSADGFWSLLPGDSKASLADGALPGGGPGGEVPAPDYALTTADQFTSPLFCDAAHPQDVDPAFLAPWSTIVGDSLGGGGGGRRRLAAAPAPQLRGDPTAVLAAPTRSACDVDVSQGATPSGAGANFNWAVDAVLACPGARASYLRRLAEVGRIMHGEGGGGGGGGGGGVGGGTQAPAVAGLAAAVRVAARADNEVWRAGDPDAAAARLALLIGARGRQLAGAYGPNGTAAPLLPSPQPERGLGGRLLLRPLPGGALAVCATAGEGGGAEGATDLSGLVAVLRGASGASLAFPPGAVVPPGGCVYGAGTRVDALEAAGRDEAGGGGGLAVPVGGLVWHKGGGGGGGDDGTGEEGGAAPWDLQAGRGGGSVL